MDMNEYFKKLDSQVFDYAKKKDLSMYEELKELSCETHGMIKNLSVLNGVVTYESCCEAFKQKVANSVKNA